VAEIVRAADDRWVGVSARTGDEIATLARLLGLPAAESIDAAAGPGHDAATLAEGLRALAAQRSADELMGVLQTGRLPAWQLEPSERILHRLVSEPVVRDAGLLQELDTPWGPILAAAPHWTFDKTPATIAGPSPQLGEHTSVVLDRVGTGDARHGISDRPLPVLEDVPLRPLAGLTVLVGGGDPATSLCGCILETLGAEIRAVGPVGREAGWLDETTAALADRVARWSLAAGDGNAEPAGGLLGSAQVVLVGADVPADDPVFGAEPVTGAFDGIWCRVSGWAAQPPAPFQPASELTVQVLTGMNRFVGTPQGTLALGYPVVIVNTALAAAQAVLAAYLHAEKTGEGQRVEVSMVGTAVALSQWNLVGESGPPDAPVGRQLEAYDWTADHGFRLSDRWCLIDLRDNEAGWLQFFVGLGRADLLADDRFNDIGSLQRHRTLLPGLLADELSKVSFDDLERFVRDELGGTIVPVLSPLEAATHPQSQGLGVVVDGPAGERRLGLPVVLRSVPTATGAGATRRDAANAV
jgi:crotonobetainyl-CoA:carnitine CoA-transferase CaiB-like acyl-CoA transferase